MPWWLQLPISVLTIIGSVLASLGAVYLARKRIFELERHKAKVDFARKLAPALRRITLWAVGPMKEDLQKNELVKSCDIIDNCFGEAEVVLSQPAFKAYTDLYVSLLQSRFIPTQWYDPDFTDREKMQKEVNLLMDALRSEIGAKELDRSLFKTIGIQSELPPESSDKGPNQKG